MTGPESAVLFMLTIALISWAVAILDWLGRRSERRSRGPRVD